MSAVFAANLVPGFARERRVAGVRSGVGRMNGRLAQYRYDRSSNRQWRRDAAAHAAGVVTEDQWYEYDGLYQVGEFQRGTLSGSYPNFSGIIPVAQNQDWNYDAMGNWLGFQSDALNQTRQFNKVNEITSINGPSGVVTPQYDPVGNMTSMPAVSNWTTAQTLKWDAWNRLVRVTEGSTTIAEYSYDALFRRVTKTVSGTTRRFYYSDQWQVLEEYLGSAADPHMRYWYGLRDINDIARRQRYSSGTTLQDDLYALRETMNVVALVNTSGTVTQRMAYDAFGNTWFLNGSTWASSTNIAGWSALFHAHYRDAETELDQMRFRFYHPNLGIWLSRDLLEEEGDVNLYVSFANSAARFWDMLGLLKGGCPDDLAKIKPAAGIKKQLEFPVVHGAMASVGDAWVVPCTPQEVSQLEGMCKGQGRTAQCTICFDVVNSVKRTQRPKIRGGKIGVEINWSWTTAHYAEVFCCKNPTKTIYINPLRYPLAACHAYVSQSMGYSRVITVDRPGADSRRDAATNMYPSSSETDRDEYPPAVGAEGGAGSSVWRIPIGDNRGAGASMGRQLEGVPDGARVRIGIGVPP